MLRNNEGPTRVERCLTQRFRGVLSLDLPDTIERARRRGDVGTAIALQHEADRRLAWVIGADRVRALRGGGR